jgi:hypothetical protein
MAVEKLLDTQPKKSVIRALWKRKAISRPFEEFYDWYVSQKRQCYYCGIDEETIRQLLDSGRLVNKRIGIRGRRLELERKIPDKDYDDFDNLTFACYWCNNAKTDTFTADEFKKVGRVFKQIWKDRLSQVITQGD